MSATMEFEDTKLHEGVRYGDTNLVESALKEGLDPNTIGLYQWSPLHEAASSGDLEILQILLGCKGNPDAQDHLHGCTAVHYAAREGHVECLEALLEMGGHYDVANHDGETGLAVAVGKCKELLDKRSTDNKVLIEVLENVPDEKVSEDHHPEKIGKDASSNSAVHLLSIDSPSLSNTPTAWDEVQVQETNAEPLNDAGTGFLQLSFEYNSRSSVMKIRVWQLEDILLPPAEVANINRLNVKSRLLPDKKGETKRKTEDVRIEDPDKLKTSIVSVKRRSAKESFKAIFLPCSFKFTKPLEYKGITKAIVESKTVHVDVNVKQKRSNKSFTVANLQIPLHKAIRQLRKRHYRLHPCINYSMSDSIHSYNPRDLIIISERMYSNKTRSDPNLRSNSKQSLRVETEQRASSEINFKTVRCHSIESIPSVSVTISDDLEEEDKGALQAVKVLNDPSPKSTQFSHSNPEIHVVDIHEMSAIELPGTTNCNLTEVKIEAPAKKISRSTPNIPVLQVEDLEEKTPPKILNRPTSPPNRLAVPPITYNRHLTKSSSSNSKQEVSRSTTATNNLSKGVITKESVALRPGRAIPVKVVGITTKSEGKEILTNYVKPPVVFHVDEQAVHSLRMKKDAVRSRVKERTKIKDDHHHLLKAFGEKGSVHSPVFKGDDTDKSDRVEYNEINELPSHNRKSHPIKLRKGDKEKGIRNDEQLSVSKSGLPMIDLNSSLNTYIPELRTVSETRFGRDQTEKRQRSARIDSSLVDVSQSKRDMIRTHNFPQTITRGLMHTEFTSPTLCPGSVTPREQGRALTNSRSQRPGSEAVVHFLSETEPPSESNYRQTSPVRRIRSPTRESSTSRSPKAKDETGIEMSALQLDPRYQRQLATPEFKMKMFQRTSQDPHPLDSYIKGRSSAVGAANVGGSREEMMDPFFVPESPTESPREVKGSLSVKSSRLHEIGSKDLKTGELRATGSLVGLKQSWL